MDNGDFVKVTLTWLTFCLACALPDDLVSSRSALACLIQTCKLFFGTCLFFIAVILLAYVPGKLLLIALKRTLTPLEDVTLACVLGLVVSGLVYWLMTFAHQGRFYLIWPLTAAGVFVWLLSQQTQIAFKQFCKP